METKAQALALLVLCWAVVAQAAPKTKLPLFPSNNCVKIANATAFRVAATVPAPKNGYYCFSLGQGPAKATASPCGRLDVLDKFELYASYDLRTKVDDIRIRDTNGRNEARTGAWYRPSTRDEQKVVVSNLNLSSAQTDGVQICFKLTSGTTLDDLCPGDAGKCLVALYSVQGSAKCCPVYSVSIA